MSDLRLFRLEPRGVSEVRSTALDLEKSLQTLIETNLEVILGVRFLATEHLTGKTHGDRNPTGVWLGSTAGMVAADGLAIIFGRMLGTHLPQRAIGYFAAVLFVIFGSLTLWEAWK